MTPAGQEHSEAAKLCPQCGAPLNHEGPQPGRCFLGVNIRPDDWLDVQDAMLIGMAMASAQGIGQDPGDVLTLILRLWVRDQSSDK